MVEVEEALLLVLELGHIPPFSVKLGDVVDAHITEEGVIGAVDYEQGAVDQICQVRNT